MTFSKQSQRIAISFIIVVGLSITMMVFDLTRMSNMQSKLDVITKEHNIKSNLMLAMKHGIYERQVSVRNIVLMEGTFERDEGKTTFSNYAIKILEARRKFSSMKLNTNEKRLLQFWTVYSRNGGLRHLFWAMVKSTLSWTVAHWNLQLLYIIMSK